jgi:hypothetical protein
VNPDRYLPPRVLQIVGLLLLAAFGVLWAITGRESVLLVGAAGSLILLGGYERAKTALVELQEPPTPPPIAPAEPEEAQP